LSGHRLKWKLGGKLGIRPVTREVAGSAGLTTGRNSGSPPLSLRQFVSSRSGDQCPEEHGALHRMGQGVAVGIRLSPYPPHRSGRADFPHPGGWPISQFTSKAGCPRSGFSDLGATNVGSSTSHVSKSETWGTHSFWVSQIWATRQDRPANSRISGRRPARTWQPLHPEPRPTDPSRLRRQQSKIT